MKNTLFGVSVGTGDPQDMTLKAKNILEKCEIWAVPRLKDGSTYAYDIAKQIVNSTKKTIIFLDFLMIKDKNKREISYRENAGKIIDYLCKDKDVALLNIGDISIYSTYSYIENIIKLKGYSTARIAGVPSFCSIASKLDISLTKMNKPIHILPSMHIDIDKALKLDGTKILMKNKLDINDLKNKLSTSNQEFFAIQNANLDGENICHSPDTLKCNKYFTTIILKNE